MDFLSTDIAATPLAKVLEVNDGRQRLADLEPLQISWPPSTQWQRKEWNGEQAPQVCFIPACAAQRLHFEMSNILEV